LPFFMPYALIKALWYCSRCDVILLGDGVLACLAWLLNRISGLPVSCVIHGLDITYKSFFYQKFWPQFFLRHVQLLLPVSQQTLQTAYSHIPNPSRCEVVKNGTQLVLGTLDREGAKSWLLKFLPGIGPDDFVVLTVGRLVERKGCAWFVSNVMPMLPRNVHYIVAGEGPMQKTILDAALAIGRPEKVHCVGYVSPEQRNKLYTAANVYVQPNIPIIGDMEGFGLVVLEAAAHGLPVVASNLEGLQDALNNRSLGKLVAPLDPQGFVDQITRLLNHPDEAVQEGIKAKEYVEQNCSWQHIAQQYVIKLGALAVSGKQAV